MNLLIAAGATGGHILPAIVVAQTVFKIRPSKILFVGTSSDLEKQLIEGAGFSLKSIQLKGFQGKGLLQRLHSFICLPGALWQSWKIIREFQPRVVFGIGGYASGPLLLLAALFGIKTTILEPNAMPGLTNRILARFVDHVFVAFSEARKFFPVSKCTVSGNPIRDEILSIQPPRFDQWPWTILIFGGSQGARHLNNSVIEMLPYLYSYKDQLRFIHQTGLEDEEKVRVEYQRHGFSAKVKSFFSDMPRMYEESTIVVARAGSSILEIASCGRPSILVPYPYAADDHQKINANIMKQQGAAVVLENADCSGSSLVHVIKDWMHSSQKLKDMSKAALHFRQETAAHNIAIYLISCASKGGFCGSL